MKKFLCDVGLMFNRSVLHTIRKPVWLIIGLFQPICFLLLFAPLLEKVSMTTPDFPIGGAMTIFIPGLLVMMAMSALFVGFHLIDDMRTGVIERYQVTPVSRSAVLLGRALRDTIIGLIQSIIIMALSLPMGFTIHSTGCLLTLILLALTGVTMALCSYALAFILKSEDALAPTLNFFMIPIQLLAGITLPLVLAPLWLQRVAYGNPLYHVVSAARALCSGDISNNTVFLGFSVVFICACLALSWALKAFRSSTN